MFRIFFILLFFVSVPCQAQIFSLENNVYCAFERKLLDDLDYAENVIFKKTFSRNDIPQRLERLELAVFGAVQTGEEFLRIASLRKAVTNVSSGGYGLQYVTKMMDLTNSGTSNNNWSFGYNSNNYIPHNYSRRIPPPRHRHSHRVSPHNYSYQSNPIINGDYSNNYSMGTGVKILAD